MKDFLVIGLTVVIVSLTARIGYQAVAEIGRFAAAMEQGAKELQEIRKYTQLVACTTDAECEVACMNVYNDANRCLP